MIRTVDLVIAGSCNAALAAAGEALQCGRRVLVVLRSADEPAVRRFRRSMSRNACADGCEMTVMTNAEVVCVDGVNGIEAIVIRYARTGRLRAVNASAFLSCEVRDSKDEGQRTSNEPARITWPFTITSTA